ncbi:MAG: hypothetical protein KKB62_00845 [Nanoarchaeota archaeon]|nr:hypothetical protein [Nanoarchaeota archaeon]
MTTNIRKHIPTSHELTCRDSMKREDLHIDLGLKEFSFIKMFFDEEITSKEFDKVLLKKDFRKFCSDNKNMKGIFYPQFTQNKTLSEKEIEVINYVQDIEESDIRLMHFIKCESLDDFKIRINHFLEKNQGKRIIPVLDISFKTNKGLILLGEKAKYISERFNECIVKYSNWKNYDLSWEIVSSLFEEIDWYVFGLPINENGGFTMIIYSLLIGANGTCHRLYRGGGNGKPNPPLFLNSDMSLRTIEKSDMGLAKYGSKDRIKLIVEDGRKSYLPKFAKWDRVVQANIFCKLNQNINDLKNVKSIEYAVKYFSK